MIAAYATLAFVLVAALVTGQALAAFAAGADRSQRLAFSWLAPAYGLAALLVAAGIAIRLPGHATTAAVVLGLITIAAAVWSWPRSGGRREAAAVGVPVVVITVLAASLPFAIA